MSHDLIKKYVVKIKVFQSDNSCKSSEGTGVIFKTKNKNDTCYVFTTKHTFFPKDIETDYDKNSLPLERSRINIFREVQPDTNIIEQDIIVYFLEDKKIDLALIVLPSNSYKIDKDYSIHYLEIFDMDNNQYEKVDFFLSGYPNFAEDVNTTNKLIPYTLQHTQFNDNQETVAKLSCKSSPILSDGYIYTQMQGISGAGIFVREDNNNVNLSHIQCEVSLPNIFLATRIDVFIDEFNKIINESPEIKTSTKIIIEDISIDEFQDFNFLKNKIKNNVILYNSKLESPIKIIEELDNISQLSEFNINLKKIHRTINDQSKYLSYLYAYCAILANQKGARRSTTLFFKKAIDLNPEHKQTFILEKSKRINNLDKIKEIAHYSIDDTIALNERLIKDEENLSEKIIKIKSAIFDMLAFDDTEIKNKKLQDYFSDLEESYKHHHTLRESYKYKELGDFYLNIDFKEKSLYFYYVAYFILLESPETEGNSIQLKNTHNLLDILLKTSNKTDNEDIKKSAIIEAKNIIEKEEDQNIKKTLEKVNQMLGTVYDDIYHIKLDEQKRKETITNLDNSLKLLKSKVEIQIDQNYSHNLDTVLINENIVKLDVFNNLLTEQLNSIQEKYHIQIDDETRNELRSIIEESTATMNSALGKITTTADQANDYIKTSEDGLKILIGHEQDGLSSIHKEIQNHLNEFSKQQIKLKTEKNEVLEFLKASELRILAKIHKFDTNTKHKNKTIELIQNKISQLQKLVNTATIIQSNNHSDLVKSANNATNDLKQIITTYQEFEKNVLGQLKNTSDYTDDITVIKRSQNRFEHSLLNQTKNAFANYEKITEYSNVRPSLSFGQKVLLSIYFIIMISCAIYFIVNYSLLDLLTNLWHTA